MGANYNVTSKPFLINNFIYHNISGGAQFMTYYSDNDQPVLVNNTIVYNGNFGIKSGKPTIVNGVDLGAF